MLKGLLDDFKTKRRHERNVKAFPEATAAELALISKADPYTMTRAERRWGLISAVKYVQARGVPGAFVEAGVWRGGSSMVAASTFVALGETDRDFWLYDTFEGMSAPTFHDVAIDGGSDVKQEWERTKKSDDSSTWCYADIEDVKRTMALSGYPADKIRYVQGKVEDTLADPANRPEKIAILRLDTDWYESTKAELETLFDRLSDDGVLILDDYGCWAGAKKAVDEYLADKPAYLMNRTDKIGRMLIKN